MSLQELHFYNREKNHVCQVKFNQTYLFNNSYHPCRDGGFSEILSFLEENLCRLFSAFQALGKNLESCCFGFLCGYGQSAQGDVGSAGFSRFLTAFACLKWGRRTPTYRAGFSIPERSVRLRFFLGSFSSHGGASV